MIIIKIIETIIIKTILIVIITKNNKNNKNKQWLKIVHKKMNK